jgi:hypothetical protein
MLFYTYLHRRASDNLPFYIGKGQGRRSDSICNRSKQWHQTVADHGLKVEIVATWSTEQEALDHERFLIWCFRDMGYLLCNLTSGGQGVSGLKHRPDVIEAMRQRSTGNSYRKGMKATAATLKRMSESQQGKTLSDNHRAKMSAAKAGNKNAAGNTSRRGIVMSQEQKDKISASNRKRWAIKRNETN